MEVKTETIWDHLDFINLNVHATPPWKNTPLKEVSTASALPGAPDRSQRHRQSAGCRAATVVRHQVGVPTQLKIGRSQRGDQREYRPAVAISNS